MKKMMKSLLASLLVLSVLVACGGSKNGAAVKLGVASSQVVGESYSDDERDMEFTTVVVGVALVDDKVAYIRIDESQQYADIEGDTLTLTQLDTKKDRGADYAMKALSEQIGIGKEWDEQIEAMEADIVGKTLDEVKAYFAGEDIKSSASIIVDHILPVVVKAIEGAVEVSDVAKVGLGYEVTAFTSEEDEVWTAESTLDYAMVAVDKDNKIVKVLLDNAQEKAHLADGNLDFENIGRTKGELKADYGMKFLSEMIGIGKEWNEQNDALMEILVGKTLDEVLAFNGDASQDDDLKSSVSILIDTYQKAIQKAFNDLGEVK